MGFGKSTSLDSVSTYNDAELRFLKLLNSLPKVSVQGYDKNRTVIFWNASSTDIYGYKHEEAIGKRLEDLIIPPAMRDDVIALHKQWVEKGIPIPSDYLPLMHQDGSTVYVFSSHVMLKADSDSPEMFCIDIDVSEQYAARQELERMATTDVLTGLPNRRYLMSLLNALTEDRKPEDAGFSVFFIDLDFFKDINDTLGHSWGDKLLCSVTSRLKAKLKSKGTLTRFGGDEFVFIAQSAYSVESAHSGDDGHSTVNKNSEANETNNKEQTYVQDIAECIIDCFERSFDLRDEAVRITCSVGISTYPADGVCPDDLLKHADLAMYHAKVEGRNGYQHFVPKLVERLQAQRTVASQLQQSLEKEEFMLVYQPQFNLQTGTINSCEALLRWCPKDATASVPPNIFIPIAERTDLIIHIGLWVIKQACEQAKLWKDAGFNIRVDVNISGKQLIEPDFFDTLEACRDICGLKPEDIGIELTENLLIESDGAVLKGLKAQREQGVEISIDDFGVGYSSLSYLKTFPLSHLKIDRSFLKDAPENSYDGALLEAIINLGHKLNLHIVAEGIETQEQADYCKKLNVEYAQGYLYSKPIIAAELEQLLLKQTQRFNTKQ